MLPLTSVVHMLHSRACGRREGINPLHMHSGHRQQHPSTSTPHTPEPTSSLQQGQHRMPWFLCRRFLLLLALFFVPDQISCNPGRGGTAAAGYCSNNKRL